MTDIFKNILTIKDSVISYLNVFKSNYELSTTTTTAIDNLILSLKNDKWQAISESTPRDRKILVVEKDGSPHVVQWQPDIRYYETQINEDRWMTQKIDEGDWEGDNGYYCRPVAWRELPIFEGIDNGA